MIALQHPTINRGITSIDAFKVDTLGDDGRVILMDIEGRKVQPTTRFWSSLCSRYSTWGLTPKLFKLFSHKEVFERIKNAAPESKVRLRYTIEDNGSDIHDGNLLAVTAPDKPTIEIEAAAETISRYAANDIYYSNGIIHSIHQPPRVEGFNIGPDKFINQYIMETPIDGYGNPLTYLSVLRMVCTNGLIGYSKAFKSEVKIGNSSDTNAMFTITRYLDSYNNEEGYAAIQKRFEAAANSYASLFECNRISCAINRLASQNAFHEGKSKLIDGLVRQRTLGGDGANVVDNDTLNMRILRAYTACTGDVCSIYGLAHLNALTSKIMQKLPAQCTVYDLFNLASEIATHFTSQNNGRILQAEIGRLISEDLYDLENTKDDYTEFQEWFVEKDSKELIQVAK